MGMGFIAGMIKTLRDNKSLLRGKNHGFKENNREGIYSDNLDDEVLKFKEVTEEELVEVKAKIHLQLKKDRQKQLKILVVSVVIGLLIIVWFVNNISLF